MAQPGEFERRRRTRVGGARQSRLIGIVVALGALLLIAMVVIASQDVPPATVPPVATRPTPQPSPRRPPATGAPADQIYALVTDYSAEPVTTYLVARDSGSDTIRFRLRDAIDAALTPDGRRLYVLYRDGVSAVDAGSGDPLWHTPLPDPNPAGGGIVQRDSLALSHSGATLAIFRQSQAQTADGLGPVAWIERVDTFSGRWLRTSRIELGPNIVLFSRLLSAADTATLYLASAFKLQAIDVDSEQVTTLLESPTGDLAVDINPAGTRLLVSVDGRELVEYDALNQRELRRVSLKDAAINPAMYSGQLLISPDGAQVALLFAEQGAPTILNGQRTSNQAGVTLAIIDPASGAVLQQRSAESWEWWQTVAWSTDSASLYLPGNNQIKHWDLRQDSVDTQPSEENQGLSKLLIGPYVAPAPPRSPPDPAPPATPAPPPVTPTPLVEAEPAPFAWLLEGFPGDQRVAEYATDGSRQIIAERVIKVIARPGQPPLLLTTPKSGSWALFDPLSAITTPLSIAVPYASTTSSDGFILSPDGRELALISERDPMPNDGLKALRQLVVVDLRSGQARALAEFDDSTLSNETLAEWGADGIYLYKRRYYADSSQPIELLRFDPAGATAPTSLLKFPNGANVALNASAGLLLYEPYPADLEQSELRLSDLRSGDERIIYTGSFVDQNQLQIAPDGSAIAYLRPLDEYQAEVLRYAVGVGTTSLLTTVVSYQSSQLRWDAAGRLVVRSYLGYDYASPLQETLFSPAGALVDQWRLPRVVLDWASAPISSPDGQRAVDVSNANGAARLTLHALDHRPGGAPRLRVSIPLAAWMLQPGTASASGIVYVP